MDLTRGSKDDLDNKHSRITISRIREENLTNKVLTRFIYNFFGMKLIRTLSRA